MPCPGGSCRTACPAFTRLYCTTPCLFCPHKQGWRERWLNLLGATGLQVQLYLQPGKPDSQGHFYRQPHAGKLAVVLGAGNQHHLALSDALHMAVVEGCAVMLKYHPLMAVRQGGSVMLFSAAGRRRVLDRARPEAAACWRGWLSVAAASSLAVSCLPTCVCHLPTLCSPWRLTSIT